MNFLIFLVYLWCGVGGVMCVPEMISGYLESFGIVNHYQTFLILFVLCFMITSTKKM